MLKPVRPDELFKALNIVIGQIDQERAGEEEKAILRQQVEQALPFIQMSFVYDLISGSIDNRQEIHERAAFFGLEFDAAVIMVIDIDDFANLTVDADELNKQILKQKVYQAVCQAAGPHAMVTPFGGDNLIVLLGFQGTPEILAKELAMAAAEKIRLHVDKALNVTVTVGVGRYYQDVRYINKSYYEALKAKQQNFFCGGNQVIHIDDLVHMAGMNAFSYPFPLEKAVLEKVRCGERRPAREGLESLMRELCGGNASVEAVKTSMLELLIVMSRAAAEGGASIELTLLNNQRVSELINCRTNEEIRRFMLDSLNRFMDNMLENRVSVNMRLINKACDYIVQNCHTNLSLDEVAQSVHLSPYYFSRLFKQHKGCNFVEFLTRTRIGLAQKLLRDTDSSIVQIALKVGYQDTSYFCRVFRQETGQTPNQYRNQIINKKLSIRGK
ncbi:AraC family transcriptional regulator [Sporomusa carbonis]|uniref:AraC family transcriptional regulator n=1 Tax=Sporomusa carbonis TaxID=3076075 RepID=UPI003C7B3B13